MVPRHRKNRFSRDGLAFRRSFLSHFHVHCIRQTFSVSSDFITAAFSLLTISRCCHICFCSGLETSFPGFRFLNGLIVPDANGLPFLAETVCGSTCSISRWFMGCCGWSFAFNFNKKRLSMLESLFYPLFFDSIIAEVNLETSYCGTFRTVCPMLYANIKSNAQSSERRDRDVVGQEL